MTHPSTIRIIAWHMIRPLIPIGHELVKGVSTQSTGKYVHESKNRGNGGSARNFQSKMINEICDTEVVHREFDSRTACILKEQEPGAMENHMKYAIIKDHHE